MDAHKLCLGKAYKGSQRSVNDQILKYRFDIHRRVYRACFSSRREAIVSNDNISRLYFRKGVIYMTQRRSRALEMASCSIILK